LTQIMYTCTFVPLGQFKLRQPKGEPVHMTKRRFNGIGIPATTPPTPRTSTSTEPVQISVKVEPAMLRNLRLIAAITGIKQQDIVHEAIRLHLLKATREAMADVDGLTQELEAMARGQG
jgi:hypothetical protein